jgi:hydrophobic/amphiphilic exporter-1 (mainly G- bacteria), HAE1 family
MLIDIVATNAIVLLDHDEQSRRRGMDARTAVIGGARRRLQPILMTAVATILALAPVTLGSGGEGGLLSTPPAPAVIGRLLTSAFFTLILVPALHPALDPLRPEGVRGGRHELCRAGRAPGDGLSNRWPGYSPAAARPA